ncbi:response regulator [Aquabacter sp. L1I39]|uniref:response regulator n=1 Tax=Aquabacter sp. L1I39 TaxID=2820278 RepID=UPI001ADC89EE|nr:response regulator [Aquabacter sp. L1I39]QTL03791.1 response regulator [Aquabacter sp. L1I39]
MDTSRRQILLVEDEPFVALVAQQILEDEGFAVHVAASGADALSIAKEGGTEIRVALVDFGLPDVRGDTLVAQLREILPGLRIVVASGYGADELVAMFRDLPGVGIVSKPYDGDTLLTALRRADPGFLPRE